MRTIFLLALLLVLVGTVAATMPGSEGPTTDPSDAQPASLEWVRTRDGWERPLDWIPPLRTHATMHPFVVASFLGLSSMLVLIAPASFRPST